MKVLFILSFLLSGYTSYDFKATEETPVKKVEVEKVGMQIKSSAFEEGRMIPKLHTCDGRNASPPLEWSGVPKGAVSLTLICEDPDAPSGTWVHWTLYNLPAMVTTLPGGIPPRKDLVYGESQGKNDFGKIGYGGPCPPSGTHRYIFKVYALDTQLNLPAGANKKQIEKAMEGHILGEGKLIGKYSRS